MSENRRTSPSFDAESQDIRSFVAAEGEAQKRPSVNLRGAASRSGRPLAQKRQRSGGRSQELLRENEPQSWQRTSQRLETRSRAGGQERLGAQPRVRTQGQRRSGSKAQARTRDRERTESRPRARTRSQESRPQERLRPQTRARSGQGKASESAKPAVTLSGVVALFSSKPRVIAAAIAALLVLIAIIALPRACASSTPDQAENSGDDASTQAAGVSYPEGSSVVSFVAVGDNLPDDFIGLYADKLAGEEDDGTYDYKPLFAHIKPYVEAADLSYINQETHVGGNDTGPQGYPSFNTTDEMADAVVDAGFDLVASATNHS